MNPHDSPPVSRFLWLLVTALLSALVTVVGAYLGVRAGATEAQVRRVEGDVTQLWILVQAEKEKAAVQRAHWEEIDRRLEKIEQKLDRILTVGVPRTP